MQDSCKIHNIYRYSIIGFKNYCKWASRFFDIFNLTERKRSLFISLRKKLFRVRQPHRQGFVANWKLQDRNILFISRNFREYAIVCSVRIAHHNDMNYQRVLISRFKAVNINDILFWAMACLNPKARNRSE